MQTPSDSHYWCTRSLASEINLGSSIRVGKYFFRIILAYSNRGNCRNPVRLRSHRIASHVALPPQSLRVGARHEVEGVHVAIHAHGYAFLQVYERDQEQTRQTYNGTDLF